MYKEHVLKHYGRPVNKGMLTARHRVKQYFGEAVSDVCGDRIAMCANSHDAVLVDLWWQGEGCCFSQAAASMLVEHMEGKLVDAVDAFTEEDMFTLFQAECPDARRGCVLVALAALRQLTEQIP
jgi:nitrogen fixation NifU-like protein